MKRGEFKMNGLSILGICMIVVSVFIIIWGATLYPINFLNSGFMSFVSGGLVLITIGLFAITGTPALVKVTSISLTTIGLIIYIIGFKEMGIMLQLLSFVPIIGLAVWIMMKILH